LPDKKSDILHSARALFSANGFKNTSVSDITKLTGVAAGTFYLYYTSKDALFMEIYLEENEKLKRSILAAVDLNGEPLRVMQEILRLNLDGMNANPILKEWYNRDVFEKRRSSTISARKTGWARSISCTIGLSRWSKAGRPPVRCAGISITVCSGRSQNLLRYESPKFSVATISIRSRDQ
jgi:AcrR family transcriptional regulator